MTTVKTTSLSDALIKTKWNEKYFSEAIGEMSSVNKPGVYRGGFLRESTTPDKSFYIDFTPAGDTDTFVMYRNNTTMESQTVKITTPIVMDMTSEFSGGGGTIPLNVTWYVGLSVDYQLGQDTSAAIIVSDAPVSGMVLFGVINMTAGDSVITDDKIDMSGDNRTVPGVLREFIVPRTVVRSVTARNYVQLAGKVFCRDISAGKSNSLVRFCDANGNPLVATDDYAINASGWYTNSALLTPITNANLDANGCYENPYVKLDFGDGGDVNYTGTIVCRYFALQGLDEISDGTDGIQDDKQPIVNTRNIISDPLSVALSGVITQDIPGGALNETLKSIFQQIKNKMENTLPSIATFDLIWSTTNTLEGETEPILGINIYYRGTQIAVTSNCSIDEAGIVSVYNDLFPVRAYVLNGLQGETEEMVCKNPAGKTLQIIFPEVNWDYYAVHTPTLGVGAYVNIVDEIYSRLVQSVKNVGAPSNITGESSQTGFGFKASQSFTGNGLTMTCDVAPIGITHQSDMAVRFLTPSTGNVFETGIKRGRTIVIDISSITGWTTTSEYSLKSGLRIEMTNMQNDSVHFPFYKAYVRQWDKSNIANPGIVSPASIKMFVNGSNLWEIESIKIIGMQDVNFTDRELIIDIETYYKDYCAY